MPRIPDEILAGIRLDVPSVRLGLELILENDRHPISMDNALAFLQKVLDDPEILPLMCDLFNRRLGEGEDR